MAFFYVHYASIYQIVTSLTYVSVPLDIRPQITGARAVHSATCNVPQAHAGGNQAEDDSVPASAGAPGEAGNVIACDYQPPHPC